MSAPRKPGDLIADYRNFQHTPHDLRFTESEERAIRKLADTYAPDNPKQAETAIEAAINSARMRANMTKVSRAEIREIYREQAKRAAAMLEFVTSACDDDGRFGAGPTFYSAIISVGTKDDRAESYNADPLYVHRALLGELLSLIEQRSTFIADQITSGQKPQNQAQHELAGRLMDAARSGHIPVTPSQSKTSRLARVFEDAAQIAGLDPGDPSKYLAGK